MTPAARDGVRAALLAAARAELVEHGTAAISLRAVARRAGVSHAAPKYHFRDRAGLLTAIATEGFLALSRALARADEPDTRRQLAALGAAYIDFGLANPALFELMFAPDHLHASDPELVVAQQQAIGQLTSTVQRLTGASDDTPTLALMSWALVHGLVALTRHGALQAAVGAGEADDSMTLAYRLTEEFTEYVGHALGRVAAGERVAGPGFEPG
ncbi:MAG: WHG domain-containing protein [Mycobacterium sp.]|uniref:TetR/AcrR family transcriptional regulator n=1 Tax=Mycobacterium sp. TaxID=1785 RepID=UPI003CC69610